ncbi:MAG: hypothetical protein KC435_13710 [Thermomicrobiales bacterium]|nr:hypothetical protein [Thermomicrobiales bacterium]
MKLSSLIPRDVITGQSDPPLTLAALFDDVIDAERVLALLRRSQLPPSAVSVILREHVLEENDWSNPYRTVLSEVVARSSLEAASKWLEGLASLILPDRAQYLTAGPVGQILSTIRDTMQTIESDTMEFSERAEIRQLSQTFQLFGLDRDESRYIEQRIVVGSPFIAITTSNTQQLRSVHRLLTRSMPVYMGLARTDISVYRRAQELLKTGLSNTGTVVIADAISPLEHVSGAQELRGTNRDLRSESVRSRYGEVIGRVEDMLYERNPTEGTVGYRHGDLSDSRFLLRYVIVRPSRKPGMGRKLIALPEDRLTVQDGNLVANVTHEELVSAPRTEQISTLSRQDEATIRRHFSSPFYWIITAED